jgi:hypothetical protein
MQLPPIQPAETLEPGIRRLFLGASGFEDRSLGWCTTQSTRTRVLTDAWVFRYLHPKGPNKIAALNSHLKRFGVRKPEQVNFDYELPYQIEATLEGRFGDIQFEEIVLDISAMNKLLILATLCKLASFSGRLRIVYSEAWHYCPSKRQYDSYKTQIARAAKFPSYGSEEVIGLRCLSSIRMQGQPVALVAFASFNEKLVSHMLRSMSPRRLLLINGRPPRKEFSWREKATQDIHRDLWERYPSDNPIGRNGRLQQVASTLDYRETVEILEEIYKAHGMYERIVCAATGSKMQTLGLLLMKLRQPDIQVEYPSPDSYYVKGLSVGVRQVHEIVIPNYSAFVSSLQVPQVREVKPAIPEKARV